MIPGAEQLPGCSEDKGLQIRSGISEQIHPKTACSQARSCDIMVCAMARLIKDGDTVFHGVSSHMPMIAVMLAKALHAPDAVHLNIPGGVDPYPAELQKYTSAGTALRQIRA